MGSPIRQDKETETRLFLIRMVANLTAIHKVFLDKYDEIKRLSTAPLKKGDKGASPTRFELLNLMKEVISPDFIRQYLSNSLSDYLEAHKDSKRPTDAELVSLMRPLIEATKSDKKIVINDSHIDMIAERVSKKVKPSDVKVNETDPMSIIDQIMSLPKGKGLSVKHIDGLEQTISAFQTQLRRGYLHGGGDTVKPGTGVTITTDASGAKTINASGGGFTILAADETPDGSSTVFTFSTATAKPSFVISDNVMMRATTASGTVNWTWSAGTKKVTMTISPADDIAGVV